MKTTCPYCGVGCGVEAGIGPDGRCTVKGDPAHPANRGRLCSKGSALADTLNDEHRLLYPEVQGRQTSWDNATDHIAARLQATIKRHGPESVAFYVSGQLLTEDYYVINKFTKGWLGTANIDSNSRLCMASSVVGHKRAFGSDTVPGNYKDLEMADLIVLVGSNLAWCHPVLFQRIMAEKERRPGLYIVVIDPRCTVTAEMADLHLPVSPDGDVALFNQLLSYLASQGACDQAYIDAHVSGFRTSLLAARKVDDKTQDTGVDANLLESFFRRFAATERTVTVYSQGVNQSRNGSDKVNAIINCHLATGRVGKPGMGPFSVTGQPNAMGGREVGGLATMLACHMELDHAAHRQIVQDFWQSPRIACHKGLCAVDMFKAVARGDIKAIWIIGTNPVDSLPEAERVRAALQACPLVIVSEVTTDSDTLACANVKLPALAWSEKDGTVTNSERCISRQRSLREPVGDARPDWWAVSAVARKMSSDAEKAFDYSGPAAVFREYAALSGRDNHGQRSFDISAAASLSDDAYQALTPFYWPWASGSPPRLPLRYFGKGRFFTPDLRARMLPVNNRRVINAGLCDRYPFTLNTGRNRDQWHTMTRTGYSVRLAGHLAEPYLAMHPEDARINGISDADIVQVSSEHADVLLRALLTDRQQPGQVFASMHWTDQFAARARVDSLVSANVDPLSSQPASKNQAVSVQRLDAGSYAYGIMRQKPALRELPAIEYWAIAPIDGGWQYELASTVSVDVLLEMLSALIGNEEESMDQLTRQDERAGLASTACFSCDGTLQALSYVAGSPVTASRSWVRQQLNLPAGALARRWQLLAGRASNGEADKGSIVCSCFNVGKSEIEQAVMKHDCHDLASVGNRLKAGTNCGSCRGEIQALIRHCRVPRPLSVLS